VVFSAGCNVRDVDSGRGRIDVEVDDLRRLTESGCRVAVLTHQGRYGDESATHVEFVAAHLSRRLGCPVEYFPENHTRRARMRAASLEPGEVVVFGNTRLHRGEERNEPKLAALFASLGNRAVVGGFSKAHRSHASNVGILRFMDATPANSLVSETQLVRKWFEPASRGSVVILGGSKIEKLLFGLVGMKDTYEARVVTGVLAEAVLVAKGRADARPLVKRWGASRWIKGLRALLANEPSGILIPETLRIACFRSGSAAVEDEIAGSDRLPTGWTVVDVGLSQQAMDAIGQAATGGRLVLAGPPGATLLGHRLAYQAIAGAVSSTNGECILTIGGDSVNECPLPGSRSTGGGAALQVLATGRTTVGQALLHTERRVR
jgi:phosphoglycerate kinase